MKFQLSVNIKITSFGFRRSGLCVIASSAEFRRLHFFNQTSPTMLRSYPVALVALLITSGVVIDASEFFYHSGDEVLGVGAN
jgi:hypothetical protein